MERGWGALMGCWGGLSVNCGERHNHLLCQYAGTNTEAWTVCTTPEMDLIGGCLLFVSLADCKVNGGAKAELGGYGYRKRMTMIRSATPLSETKSTRGAAVEGSNVRTNV
uniref:Uncharacterized protein n=1 Tax=Oryza meridionalis TaxID=40149 RepID=A0A0E0E3N0_9ORYZ